MQKDNHESARLRSLSDEVREFRAYSSSGVSTLRYLKCCLPEGVIFGDANLGKGIVAGRDFNAGEF